ncbi:MAG: HEAT repeat domain-containing protein [Oligoflexia bacterium]|nr:HEAT repeat domain-containing protein [Oligoflexia bacterium]
MPNAQAQTAPKGAEGVFISAAREELGSEALQAEIHSEGSAEILRRLAERTPTRSSDALQAIKELLQSVDQTHVRAAIITGMRSGHPRHFDFSEVRVLALQALAPYGSEAEVVQLCVEEFQTHAKDQHSCLAAKEILKKIDLGGYQKSKDFLRWLTETKPLTDGHAPLPGMNFALELLLKDPNQAISKKLEDTYIAQAIQSYRSSAENAEANLNTLAALNSPRAWQTICKIALNQIKTREFAPRPDSSLISDMAGSIGAGLAVGFASGLILALGGMGWRAITHSPPPEIGTLVNFGAWIAGFSAFGSFAILRDWVDAGVDWLTVTPDNISVRISAMAKVLQTLPNAAVEQMLLKAVGKMDLNPEELSSILTALGRSDAPETITALLKLVDGQSQKLQIAAIQALAPKCRSHPQVADALKRQTESFVPEVRQAALTAMTYSGESPAA